MIGYHIMHLHRCPHPPPHIPPLGIQTQRVHRFIVFCPQWSPGLPAAPRPGLPWPRRRDCPDRTVRTHMRCAFRWSGCHVPAPVCSFSHSNAFRFVSPAICSNACAFTPVHSAVPIHVCSVLFQSPCGVQRQSCNQIHSAPWIPPFV